MGTDATQYDRTGTLGRTVAGVADQSFRDRRTPANRAAPAVVSSPATAPMTHVRLLLSVSGSVPPGTVVVVDPGLGGFVVTGDVDGGVASRPFTTPSHRSARLKVSMCLSVAPSSYVTVIDREYDAGSSVTWSKNGSRAAPGLPSGRTSNIVLAPSEAGSPP